MMIVFARQSRFLPTDWSSVWEIFLFSGTSLPRYVAENDARFKLREMRVHAMVNTRCEGTDYLGETVPRSVGTSRKQFPRHAEIVRPSPGVAWHQLEARASPDSHVLPACLPILSFFLRIFDHRDSINRFPTYTRLYVTGPRVRAPRIVVFKNRALSFFIFYFFFLLQAKVAFASI